MSWHIQFSIQHSKLIFFVFQCFMNSILQCLSHCWPLRDRILSGGCLQHNKQSKMRGKLYQGMWTELKRKTFFVIFNKLDVHLANFHLI